MENQETLISLKDAAHMLEIEPATLRKYAQKGKIMGEKPSGRWYFTRQTIQARKKTSRPINNAAVTPRNSIDLRKHWDLLNSVLGALLPSLKYANEIETEKHVEFGNIVLTSAEQNGDAYINDKHQRLLLEHLKTEIPELQEFNSWLDMTAGDLTYELLDKLTVINTRGHSKANAKDAHRLGRS